MNSTPCEKRVPTLIRPLNGQAQVTARSIPLATLIFNIGLENTIVEMDKKFGCDCTCVLHNNVSAFFDYTWDKSMTVEEFLAGLHTRVDEIHKLELSDELKGHVLLRQSTLDVHDRNFIVRSSGGENPLQDLSTCPRNV